MVIQVSYIAWVMAWQISTHLAQSLVDFVVEVILGLERIRQPIAIEA